MTNTKYYQEINMDTVLKKSSELKIGGVLSPAENSSTQTPTGSWRSLKPNYLPTKCIQCLRCVQACPENCIAVKDGRRVETDFDFCKGCGICAQICPVKAIIMQAETEK